MKFIKTIIFGFTLGFVSYLSLSGDNGANLNNELLNDKQLDLIMSVEIRKTNRRICEYQNCTRIGCPYPKITLSQRIHCGV